MYKREKILAFFIAAMILGVLILIHGSPPPVDWSPSYAQKDSRPLGAQVFYDLLKSRHTNWQDVNIPPFEWIPNAPKNGIYVFINQDFNTDEEELGRMLEWVNSGGHLFISASNFSPILMENLAISTAYLPSELSQNVESVLRLSEPMNVGDSLKYEKPLARVYFDWNDSIPVNQLGSIGSLSGFESSDFRPNFIQIQHGEGLITLHAFPEAFSNYFLLKTDKKNYSEQLMGIWDPNDPLLLDHYIKAGKPSAQSPLYLFLENKYLKAAYFTCWVLLVLWVIFEGKRKQRAIRVISPLKNQSLEFAKTIASIYRKSDNLKEIGQLQIGLFWDYCRNKFNQNFGADKLDAVDSLSGKSGVDPELTKATLMQLTQLEKKEVLDVSEIQHIYHTIQRFKTQQKNDKYTSISKY